MLTLLDCLAACNIELSALDVINKLVFKPRKAYTTSTSGETYYEFGSHVTSKVKKLVKSVKSGKFKFKPSKKIRKKTKPTKIRDIYLSNWEDKIIETWLNDSLNELLDGWFSDNSFAYRTNGFGLDSCQHQITKIFNQNRYYAKRDIRNYFYSIDHDILLKQLRELIDPDDFLFELVRQRVQFEYEYGNETRIADIGIPFGSAVACTLSNIFLTELDKEMDNFDVVYFRYADDILIVGSDPTQVKAAVDHFDEKIASLNLELKPSYTQNMSFEDHDDFDKITKFKYLGLEYMYDGTVRLSVEKQRKIMNMFKREMKAKSSELKKVKSVDQKLEILVPAMNDVVQDRIRSAAIIDYYLKHVNDELQLKNMDRLLAERVISCITGKPFRKGHFRIVSFKKLRGMGLISLLHRSRLHRHGHLRVSFLSMHNELLHKRHVETMRRREERINHMKMGKKIRKAQREAAAECQK
jgi:retron-type reverse transcriptase